MTPAQPPATDDRTGLDRVFLSREHRVRSGWVVLAFAVVALITLTVLNVALSIADLEPRAWRLDDLRVGVFTCTTLLAGVVATGASAAAFHEPTGLKDVRWARRLLLGLGAGALLVTLSVVGAALAGHGPLRLSAGEGALSSALVQLAAIGPTSVGEELLFRGVPLLALARGTRPAAAVVGTALVFGLVHLMNPHGSLLGATYVALVGVWFGALVVRTGSLWTSIGAHVAWNWFEGFVWGQPVSGITPGPSLFTAPAAGAAGFWSGGAFGPEASGWTAVLLGVAVALTLAWPRGRMPRSAP